MADIKLATFESNVLANEVSTSSASATGTIQILNTAPKNGTYGLQVRDTDTVSGTKQTFVQWNFAWPASNKVQVEFWQRVSSRPAANSSTNIIAKSVLSFRDAGGSRQAWLGLIRPGTGTQLRGAYRTKAGTDTFLGLAQEAGLNSWIKVRYLVDKSGASPVVTWWGSADGTSWTLVATATDATAGANGLALEITHLRLGINHLGTSDRVDWTLHFDDVLITDGQGVVLTTYRYPPSIS